MSLELLVRNPAQFPPGVVRKTAQRAFHSESAQRINFETRSSNVSVDSLLA